jgi:hypothetical protein
VFVVSLVIIASFVFVVAVFIDFIIVSVTGLIATVGGACTVILHFLLPIVQINAASSIFWVEESGHDTWETAHGV